MKHEIKLPEAPLHPSYPRLGKGHGSGLPYVQVGEDGLWYSLTTKDGTTFPHQVTPFPVGTTLTLTQE